MSIKLKPGYKSYKNEFEIDVILDEYQTFKGEYLHIIEFEIDVILDEYQTACGYNYAVDAFEIDVILDEYQTKYIFLSIKL